MAQVLMDQRSLAEVERKVFLEPRERLEVLVLVLTVVGVFDDAEVADGDDEDAAKGARTRMSY